MMVASESFRLGKWVVLRDLNQIHCDDEVHRLEPKVMNVLVCLAEHPGELLPKERIIQSVWGNSFVSDEVLTNAISALRRAFGDDAKYPRFIETIPRRGYRLVADVVLETELESYPAAHRDVFP